MSFRNANTDKVIDFFVQERLKSRFSQADVSRFTGIPLSSYQRIEQKRRDPRLSEIHLLCCLYDLSWLDLMWVEFNKRSDENKGLADSLQQIPEHIRKPLLELIKAVGKGD